MFFNFCDTMQIDFEWEQQPVPRRQSVGAEPVRRTGRMDENLGDPRLVQQRLRRPRVAASGAGSAARVSEPNR